MTCSPKSPPADERSARLAGIGLMLLSIFMFSFGDALGKFMVATYSVGQLLWFRACAALMVLLPMIWRNRRIHSARTAVAAIAPGDRCRRSKSRPSFSPVYLPLADVITYYLACPIFVTALSASCSRARSAGGAGPRS